jgi:UDP-glucose 4-epimerase
MEKSKNILVTGGAGYIGSHTVKELLERHYKVFVIDNLSRGHRSAVTGGTFVEADLSNRRALEGFFKKHDIDAVIHFAAFAYIAESVADPVLYYRNNFINTLNLLEAMKAHGVKKIIFSSSCSTYGESGQGKPITEKTPQAPINPYARTKYFSEQAILDMHRNCGLDFCILRYFNAAGADVEGELGEDHDPEPHLIPLVLTAALKKTPVSVLGTDYPTKDGTCVRDYVHVTDLAIAHALALGVPTAKNEVFNLGTGKGFSVLSIVRKCEEITGNKIRVKPAARRPGDPAILVADNSKARRGLKWTPRYSDISTVISTAWKWMRKNEHGYGD